MRSPCTRSPRNRRVHDLVMFAGLCWAWLISLLPMLVLRRGGAAPARCVGCSTATRSPRRPSPGARERPCTRAAGTAALRAGGRLRRSRSRRRGVSAGPRGPAVPRRARLGAGARASGTRAAHAAAGAMGALVEKDLRVSWRDPASRRSLLHGRDRARCPAALPVAGDAGPAGRSPALRRVLVGAASSARTPSRLERHGAGAAVRLPGRRLARSWWPRTSARSCCAPGLAGLSLGDAALAGPPRAGGRAVVLAGPGARARRPTTTSPSSFPLPAPAAGRDRRPRLGHARPRARPRSALVAMSATLAVVPRPFVFLAWLPHLLAALAVARHAAAGARAGPARSTSCSSGRRAPAAAPRARAARASSRRGVRRRRPRVAIVGLGLVGGSLARGLTRGATRDRHRLAARCAARAARARDRDGATRAEAAARGRRGRPGGPARHEPAPAAPPGARRAAGARCSPTCRASRATSCARRPAGPARLRGRPPDGGHREARLRRLGAGPVPGPTWWLVPSERAGADAQRARPRARRGRAAGHRPTPPATTA